MRYGSGKRSISSPNFCGLDTETVDGYCRVLALSTGTVYRIESCQDVINFLAETAGDGICFMAWNADYDIQALIKYFPKETRTSLIKGIEIVYEEDKIKLTFQYIKGKFFCWNGNYIFDSYQYYQSSLRNAAKKYLCEEDQKGDIDGSMINEENIYSPAVIDYCIQDAIVCLKLFLLFYAALPENLKKTKPISCAYYSYVHFKQQFKENRPKRDVNFYFRHTYHGGRFEILERGYFTDLWVYDINSAYPYEIQNLEGLENTHTLNTPAYIEDATYSVFKIQVDVKDKFLSPIIQKTRAGLCIYPVGPFEGYVTKSEFERIRKYKPKIIEAFHIFGNGMFPFRDEVLSLYHLRKTSGFSLPYKIILNSAYGKTAQAIEKYVRPELLEDPTDIIDYYEADGVTYVKFEDVTKSNFVYASEITARTRCRLYDLMDKYRDNVVMVQTDSVICKHKIDLPLSDNLGDWKLERWDEAYLIGSGVYFYRKGKEWFCKFRGFNLSQEKAKDILKKVMKSKSSKVSFPMVRRVSLQEAARIHDDDLGNVIREVSRSMNLNFDSKRIWMDTWKNGLDIKKSNIKSLALINSKDLDKLK
jgi:hypothetical protein